MAPLPEEWSWLDELPPSWNPPEELRHPTKIPHLNLAVMLLGSGVIGNDIIKLVGEHVAERSELTIWVAQHDPPKSFKEKHLLAQLGNEGVDSVYRCWLAYSAAFRSGNGRVGTYEDERAALIIALQAAITALRSARGDGS